MTSTALRKDVVLIDSDLQAGLSASDQIRLQEAATWAREVYGKRILPVGIAIHTYTYHVAKHAAQLNMDADSRVAALLSRIISIDPKLTTSLAEKFGHGVLHLVRGLEKLRHLDHSLQRQSLLHESKSKQQQSEALRKMLLVMADDMRIIVLKLISRIETLRYIYKHPTDSVREIAYSTLHYFAPLANRLAIYQLKWPLEDLSFRIIDPHTYKTLARQLESTRDQRDRFIKNILQQLQELIKKSGITATVTGRAKHFYSIHKKMQRKDLPLNALYDLNATRMLVNNLEDCYHLLDCIHAQWSFIQEEFDDYIARPKENGYRSLHTVITIDHLPVEVQIRTHEMHQHAEFGLASHWRYKEGTANDMSFDKRLNLLRELMSWQKDIIHEDKHLKSLTENIIYCLTPKGTVFDLPAGSTPIDFAYRIHSDIGHRCRGARIDGTLMPLHTPLKNGQCVDIITAKTGGPSRDWLMENGHFLKSNRARNKVRQWFNSLAYEERIHEGRTIWLRQQTRLRSPGKAAPSGEEIASQLGFDNIQAFYLAMARGEVGMHYLQALIRGTNTHEEVSVHQSNTVKSTISSRHSKKPIKPPENITNPSTHLTHKVSILDLTGLAYQKASCCSPVPPQPIIGYITRKNMVSVHRANCQELRHISNRLPERVIAVAWQPDVSRTHTLDQKTYPLSLILYGQENLLVDMMELVHQEQWPVTSMTFSLQSDIPDTVAVLHLTLNITEGSEKKVMKMLRHAPYIHKVTKIIAPQ